MAILSKEESAALSQASGNAAIDQALGLLKTDKEAIRAAHWNGLPEKVRMAVCELAGIDAKKGKRALRNMDALERGKVHCEARRLLKQLEILLRCAQGGDMPGMPMAPHSFDGIAAEAVQ